MVTTGQWQDVSGITYELVNRKGNVGQEAPVLDQTRDGVSRARFDVAINRHKRDESGQYVIDGADWHSVTVLGAAAENITASLQPGSPVLVSGRGTVSALPMQEDDGTLGVRIARQLKFNVQVAPDLSRSTVQMKPSVRAQVDHEVQQSFSTEVRTGAPTQQPTTYAQQWDNAVRSARNA